MTTVPETAVPFLIDRGVLSPVESLALAEGAALVPAEVAVVEVTGPGAVPCIQGLLTNDLDRPGDGAFIYGAVLTPKGMIVCDMWAARQAGTVTLVLPDAGRPALEGIMARSLPPRLARPTDRSATLDVYRLVGPRALDLARTAGLAIPENGRVLTAIVGGTTCLTARPAQAAPFALQVHVERTHAHQLVERLERAGVVRGSAPCLELVRIIAGWPRLGAEIDDRTLPQEVRYDVLEGVSYTKGCYVGQETVARLHFRGHANRELVGLHWDQAPDPADHRVLQEERERGWVTSIAWLDSAARYLGLAKVRRDVNRARPVTAGGVPAQVVELPFTT